MYQMRVQFVNLQANKYIYNIHTYTLLFTEEFSFYYLFKF